MTQHSGDVDSPTGWFGRAGKCIVIHDSVGFVSRSRYASEEAAVTVYNDLCLTYDDWSHELTIGIESDTGPYDAACSCGWMSEPCDDMEEAEKAFDDHCEALNDR